MQNLTRRQLLLFIGAAGGSSALLKTSLALGLMPNDPFAGSISVKPAPANKKPRIAILGAGIAGLTAAYELERAGYQCTILEASFRPGGRNLTVRHGDKIDEMGHPRICQFDKQENLYFNCGPARIPGHHQRLLHYCRVLNVPLEVKANNNRLAYWQEDNHFDSKPKRILEYHTDARGLMSELLWKSVNKQQFEQQLGADDVEKLMQFVRVYGDLNEQGKYLGSERAGTINDRMLEFPVPHAPMELSALLNSQFWQGGLHAGESYDWCEPLMEVKGGMDGIVKAFVKNIRSSLQLNAQVKKIINVKDGVEITYEQKGKLHTSVFDYCFNNIPAYFMAGIENNFSGQYQEALNSLKRGRLFKIGLQMRERFWEKEGIYGGISYTSQPVAQLWYPSHDIHGVKGVMLGAYCWDAQQCEYFESLTPEERIKVAADCGEKLHPGYAKHIEHGVSVPWARMNHQMGCGIEMSPEDRKKYFALLQQPEGRHFMIGDQISYHSGWQEGAIASTEKALQAFNTLSSHIIPSEGGAAYVS
jgi:monoamine oxidase